jgi:hypothetical protein
MRFQKPAFPRQIPPFRPRNPQELHLVSGWGGVEVAGNTRSRWRGFWDFTAIAVWGDTGPPISARLAEWMEKGFAGVGGSL